MSDEDDGLYAYNYRGDEGERVPETVVKLIVNEGVQVLPDRLCYEFADLQEVTLPIGLIKIGEYAFYKCRNLLDIRISCTVKFIGRMAFQDCRHLQTIEFGNEMISTSSSSSTTTPTSPSQHHPHHRLKTTIGEQAFLLCKSLQRIKLPSSVYAVGPHAFEACAALIEANLSTTTGLAEISDGAFCDCALLQTVSLPNTMERIGESAFCRCYELVTVVVPLDSRCCIQIGSFAFTNCRKLANLVLPKGSTADEYTFTDCRLLHERYGDESFCVVLAGLMVRFEDFPLHRMCYDHSATTLPELRQCIEEEQGDSFLDRFGMSPFHVLFSTAEPRIDLLQVLLDRYSYQIWNWKDANDRRPLDYLIKKNWRTDSTSSLMMKMTLQKWMIDPLARWGTISWMEIIQSKVQDILVEDDPCQRAILYNGVYSCMEHYENVEATSILEMALWKWKLNSGWTSDGTKRQARDREGSRCLNGSDVVIPSILGFFCLGRSTNY